MLIRLIRDARIHHKAGEIVDVSPAEYTYLVTTHSGVPVVTASAAKETPETDAPTKTTRKAKK